ncbi:hypothetical protein T484DRAFT_1809337 [Baffinella frigidus]|nr:hypothetical protein T484DRAFT_1809337 [Cryptophyta sp. CCMP2293]
MEVSQIQATDQSTPRMFPTPTWFVSTYKTATGVGTDLRAYYLRFLLALRPAQSINIFADLDGSTASIEASAPPPAHPASFRTSGFKHLLKPFSSSTMLLGSWRKTKKPARPATNKEVSEMQAIDQSQLRRRPSSAGGRCGSGSDQASTPPPALGASFRTSGFFSLAGKMGASWRKTKTPKAGAEEASCKQEIVPEVLAAPALKTWETVARSFKNLVATARASTGASGAGDILWPTVPTSRTRAEPSSDPIATFDAPPLRKLNQNSRAHSVPALRRTKTVVSKEGAGSRLLNRVLELRASELQLRARVRELELRAPPMERSYSNHGIPVKRADSVENFARPKNMPAADADHISQGGTL